MGKFLAVADLHLTNRPQDEYRWDCLQQIKTIANDEGVDSVFILGDLCSEKDNHSAALVNRLVDWLDLLSADRPVHILMGNHDYIDPDMSYWRFLSKMPRVFYHDHPDYVRVGGHNFLFFPHTRNFVEAWKFADLPEISCVCLHQPFIGARAMNGRELDGPKIPDVLKRIPLVISGDIHNRQNVGPVRYLGAPYPIDFDDYGCGAVWILQEGDNRELERRRVKLVHPWKRRMAHTDMDGLSAGTHVKITVDLPRSSFHQWEEVRQSVVQKAKDLGLLLYSVELRTTNCMCVTSGIEPAESPDEEPDNSVTFTAFCKHAKCSAAVQDYGHGIMEKLQ